MDIRRINFVVNNSPKLWEEFKTLLAKYKCQDVEYPCDLSIDQRNIFHGFVMAKLGTTGNFCDFVNPRRKKMARFS